MTLLSAGLTFSLADCQWTNQACTGGLAPVSFPGCHGASGCGTKKGAIFLREMEVIIDTEEIAEFFFQELLKRGYAPVVEELEEIADITFDYLLMKCIIDEELED